MLALGSPGSGTAAILLGGLMVWGLNPGPCCSLSRVLVERSGRLDHELAIVLLFWPLIDTVLGGIGRLLRPVKATGAERTAPASIDIIPGHHMALKTGLAHTTGELISLSDGDLDEEPKLMIQFQPRFVRVDL
jgi:hypothetical protein